MNNDLCILSTVIFQNHYEAVQERPYSYWSPVPLKGTGDYKLLLAGSRIYVYCIIKGNARICPSGRHPISGAKDSLGKLYRKRHIV